MTLNAIPSPNTTNVSPAGIVNILSVPIEPDTSIVNVPNPLDTV